MSPSELKQLAIDFWLENGTNPTHVFLTDDQYNTLNSCFIPKSSNAGYTSKMTSYTLENGVELMFVKCTVLNDQDYDLFPKLIRSEK